MGCQNLSKVKRASVQGGRGSSDVLQVVRAKANECIPRATVTQRGV